MNHYERRILDCALNIYRLENCRCYINLDDPQRGMMTVYKANVPSLVEVFRQQMTQAAEFVIMDRSDTRLADFFAGGMGI